MGLTKGLKQIAADFRQLLGKDKAPRDGRTECRAAAEMPITRVCKAHNSAAVPCSGSSPSPYSSLPNIPSLPHHYKLTRDALSDDGAPATTTPNLIPQVEPVQASSSAMPHGMIRSAAGSGAADRALPVSFDAPDAAAAVPTSIQSLRNADASASVECSLLTADTPALISAPTSAAMEFAAEGQRLNGRQQVTCAQAPPVLSVPRPVCIVAITSCSIESTAGAAVAAPTTVMAAAGNADSLSTAAPPQSTTPTRPEELLTAPASPVRPMADGEAGMRSTERKASRASLQAEATRESNCSAADTGAARPLPPSGLLYLSPSPPVGMCSGRGFWSAFDFAISRKLHKGYSSSVYKATCLPSGSEVVLKAYPLTSLSKFLQNQVLRELDIHSRLHHPGVVQLLAAFREGDNLVMVQEYIRGGSLDRVRRKLGGRMTEFQAMHLVLLPLLGVLQHLHSEGIVHRDIKPDNLLFTDNWKLKVCDFGVSICLREERAVTRTGTREYFAPEVDICPPKRLPEDNKDIMSLVYSSAVDVWSVGALMYELMVGFTPFPGGPPLRKDGACGSAGASLAFPASVSAAARAFVRDCLQIDPADRPTVEQLLDHKWIREALVAAEALIINK